jgi:hypothetical protein
MKLNRMALIAAGVVAIAGPAFAHHSFAMFDSAKEVTLVGTIKEFQWTNPHTWIQINVPDASGKLVEWSIEGGSPNGLARRGWKSTSLKPGEKVTLTTHPMKDGSAGGSLMKVVKADGTVVGG